MLIPSLMTMYKVGIYRKSIPLYVGFISEWIFELNKVKTIFSIQQSLTTNIFGFYIKIIINQQFY